jgi:hypothetical protein
MVLQFDSDDVLGFENCGFNGRSSLKAAATGGESYELGRRLSRQLANAQGSRRDAETCTRDACAPRRVIGAKFFLTGGGSGRYGEAWRGLGRGTG